MSFVRFNLSYILVSSQWLLHLVMYHINSWVTWSWAIVLYEAVTSLPTRRRRRLFKVWNAKDQQQMYCKRVLSLPIMAILCRLFLGQSRNFTENFEWIRRFDFWYYYATKCKTHRYRYCNVWKLTQKVTSKGRQKSRKTKHALISTKTAEPNNPLTGLPCL